MILFATDLDNTLIYSYKKVDSAAICVEMKDGKELSFMTPNAYSLLQQVAKKTVFVPVTTRSLKQYKRIRLLKEGYPKYALTSNGGILLVDNKVDRKWYKETKKMIQNSMNELYKGIDIMQNDSAVCNDPKIIDGVFAFAKTQNIADSTNALKEKLDLGKVTVANHGKKIYVIPNNLNKGMAVQRLKKVFHASFLICAGDSYLDIPMLQLANHAVIPSHRKLDVRIPKSKLLISESKGMKFADKILHSISPYIED